MSEKHGSSGIRANKQQGFRVPMMFHPSHDVLSLGETERWFERVFGRRSTSLASLMNIDKLEQRPDYSTWTMINDLYFDSIDPSLYVLDGASPLPAIKEPHLRRIAWYVDGLEGADASVRGVNGMNAVFRALKRHGIRLTNELFEVVEGDNAPRALFGSKRQIFFTVPEDAGLSYSFLPPVSSGFDPRLAADWTIPKVSPDDPLGIVQCSHHTILTNQPNRALKVLRDVLGGNVFHEGRNEHLGATSLYVHVGGSTVECAVPDRGTSAYSDWKTRSPNDTYHAITLQVADLAKAERHLVAQGVKIQSRSHDVITITPETGLGIPWGFSSSLAPGDPRDGKR